MSMPDFMAGNMLSRRRLVGGLAVAGATAASPVRLGATEIDSGSRGRMSENDNIGIIKRQHELLSTGDIEAAAALFSDPTRNHGRPVPRRAILAILGDIKATFPDCTFPIEEITASGSNVMVRCRFRGTHLGVAKLPVNGGLMIDVAPTGRHMDVQHIHWYVLENGLVAEHWASRDDIAMMQQLGLLPETKFDFSRLATPPGQ
jgi:predicted ester cyclase